MLVLCSVRRAPKGHLCCWSFCFCCCGKLSYWPCLTVLSYSQSPRAPLLMIYIFGSSSKGHLLIWYIESCQKSVIWDERLFVSVSDSIFLCLCPPGFVFVQSDSKRGVWEKKNNDTSPVYSEVFSSARWKHNTRVLILPLAASLVIFSSQGLAGVDILIFLHHTMILITLDQIVMCKGRKKSLPLSLLHQHSVLFNDLDFFFFLLVFQVFSLKSRVFYCLVQIITTHLPNEVIWFLFLSGTWLACFASLLYCNHKCNLCPSVVLQRFVGNMNSEAVVQNKLSHPVRTRFLRFVPRDWNPSGWMGLRVEVFGCSYSE